MATAKSGSPRMSGVVCNPRVISDKRDVPQGRSQLQVVPGMVRAFLAFLFVSFCWGGGVRCPKEQIQRGNARALHSCTWRCKGVPKGGIDIVPDNPRGCWSGLTRGCIQNYVSRAKYRQHQSKACQAAVEGGRRVIPVCASVFGFARLGPTHNW